MPIATRFKFTKKSLAEVKCPPEKSKIRVSDSEVPSLTMTVTRNGSRAYYLYRKIPRHKDRKRFYPYPMEYLIGSANKLTPEQARGEAGKLNGQIAEGGDPWAEKVAARADSQKAVSTLETMWEGYKAHHLDQKKQRTRDEFTRLYDAHIKPLAGREFATITTEELEVLKLAIGKAHGKYTANRVLAILSSMFTQRAKKLPNPVKDVTRYDENVRKRVLSDDELARIIDAVNADENPIVQDFFSMLWLTGARKSNVAEMQFQHVSKNKAHGVATWTIPGEQTKNGDPLTVALPAKAVEIITRREASNPEGNPYVFPARRITPAQVDQAKAFRDAGMSTHEIAEEMGISQSAVMRSLADGFKPGMPAAFVGAAKAWERILERAKITNDLPRIHDVRRTFGTHLAESGTSLQVAANIMGHKSMETTLRVYSHARADAVQAAHLDSVSKMETRISKARQAAEAEMLTAKGGNAAGAAA